MGLVVAGLAVAAAALLQSVSAFGKRNEDHAFVSGFRRGARFAFFGGLALGLALVAIGAVTILVG